MIPLGSWPPYSSVSLPPTSRHYSIRDGLSNPKKTIWGRVLRLSRRWQATLAVIIIVAGFFSTAYALHLFGPSPPNCWVRPIGSANTAVFTVVMANEGLNVGFNGSCFNSFHLLCSNFLFVV